MSQRFVNVCYQLWTDKSLLSNSWNSILVVTIYESICQFIWKCRVTDLIQKYWYIMIKVYTTGLVNSIDLVILVKRLCCIHCTAFFAAAMISHTVYIPSAFHLVQHGLN